MPPSRQASLSSSGCGSTASSVRPPPRFFSPPHARGKGVVNFNLKFPLTAMTSTCVSSSRFLLFPTSRRPVLVILLLLMLPLLLLTECKTTTPKPRVSSSLRSLTAHNRARMAGEPRQINCNSLKYDLVKRQRKMCRKYPKLISTVFSGFGLAWEECQRQFRHSRWDCRGHKNRNVFQMLHNRGTREAAFLLAVTSAGVAFAVTKECSAGLHTDCGCDNSIYTYPKKKNHRWSGCSDNIHFGTAFTKLFIDSYERRTRKRNQGLALSKIHNNGVGRQMIRDMMRVKCKCHGVSGSCEFKTCWRSLPSFQEVGDRLKTKFDSAVYVALDTNRLKPRELRQAKVKNNLVYMRLSPDFCYRDDEAGSVGTQGRICNQSATAPNNCNTLCCRRGYSTRRVVQTRQCRCEFVWCCVVKCDKCRVPVAISECL